MAFLLLSVAPGLTYGSPRAKIHPPEKLVAIAEMLAFKDFPKATDILAIAKVESSYDEKARNGISRGVMQVNHGPWEVSANVQAGTKMLRDLYEKLGSVSAAVMAYNIGIGNYLKGKRNHTYLSKYQGAKHEIVSSGYLYRAVDSSSSNAGIHNHPRIFGSSGGILFIPNPAANQDTVCGWQDLECFQQGRFTGQVSTSLGEIERSESWGSSSGSSAVP